MTPEQQITDELSQFYSDPLGYVMFAFPWDTDRSIQLVKLAEKYRGVLTVSLAQTSGPASFWTN